MSEARTLPGGELYNYGIIRQFTIMTLVWGIAGMTAGVFIALELAYPELVYGLTNNLPFFNFSRFRPVHTSIVLYGFGGSALFATSYYVVQRTCQARLFSDNLASFTFWGWQFLVLVSVLGYPLGVTQSREYAEMVWPVDIGIALVWFAYLAVFLGTVMRRSQPHIYVANWFYLAYILAVALLHVFNNLQVPVTWTSWQSYSVFAGVQDAMTQWWYGHNVVGFILTAGFLGMMYYFVPKQAGRPVYSYRLSIIHFWALVFLYMWVGGHHLHWTSLPDWVSTLAATFSVMLLMPSWGGMINGIMTLSGAWDRLRTDPLIKFMVVALSFYGMSTFEGPMMALQNVNALSHYTDWTIGHVHSGALGWVAMITFGSLYHLVPRLWNTELYSVRLANAHFWLATVGVLFYIVAMWISGILQGLMWRAFDEYGNLVYTFAESVEAMHPFYAMRAFGGLLFLTGMILLTYNCWQTIRLSQQSEDPAPATR